MTTTRMFGGALLGLLALASTPPPVEAQESDPRWFPWVGCWEPAGEDESGDLICVRFAGAGVEVTEIADGTVRARQTLVADGRAHPIEAEGCEGTRSAEFSADGQVYREDGGRFLNGTPNIPGFYAGREGIRIVGEIGVDAIREKSQRLTGQLIDRARELGFGVNSPLDPELRGGHVTVDVLSRCSALSFAAEQSSEDGKAHATDGRQSRDLNNDLSNRWSIHFPYLA